MRKVYQVVKQINNNEADDLVLWINSPTTQLAEEKAVELGYAVDSMVELGDETLAYGMSDGIDYIL